MSSSAPSHSGKDGIVYTQVDHSQHLPVHGGGPRRRHLLACLLNLVTTAILGALIGLAVYVNLNQIIVARGKSSSAYRNLDLSSTTSWNVGCTILGTAVGLLAAWSFASQDDIKTRRELTHHGGVAAIFLRPLTLRRGWEQIVTFQMPPLRSALLLLTIVSTLATASIVALFGIKVTEQDLNNPYGSFPLGALNATLFEHFYNSGGIFPSPAPTTRTYYHLLPGFLYRAAYIEGLKQRGVYDDLDLYIPKLQESGNIGDVYYASLNTGGIGLNTSSYRTYISNPDGYSIPTSFELRKISGEVYGTRISVSCTNVTGDYRVISDDLLAYGANAQVMSISKPGGANLTLYRPPDYNTRSLTIGSHVRAPSPTSDPVHTIVIPYFSLERAFVLECSWSGQEYKTRVTMNTTLSPLVVEADSTRPGPAIGPAVKQLIANTTNYMLARAGGGELAQALVDARWNDDGRNTTAMAAVVEKVFAQVGEAHVSLMRQTMERADLYDARSHLAKGVTSYVTATVRVERVGGSSGPGQWGWLAVLAVLFLGTLFGTARLILPAQAVGFEAQDVVRLLANTQHYAGIGEKSRANAVDGIILLGVDNQ